MRFLVLSPNEEENPFLSTIEANEKKQDAYMPHWFTEMNYKVI